MAKLFKDFRKESKKNWGVQINEGESIDTEYVNLGATLRIADALEDIAKDKRDLFMENENNKKRVELLRDNLNKEERRNAALRGVITRLKNKLNKQ